MDGAIWSMAIVLGPIALAVGLAYGLFKFSTRSRSVALKQARDQATHDLYNRKV